MLAYIPYMDSMGYIKDTMMVMMTSMILTMLMIMLFKMILTKFSYYS